MHNNNFLFHLKLFFFPLFLSFFNSLHFFRLNSFFFTEDFTTLNSFSQIKNRQMDKNTFCIHFKFMHIHKNQHFEHLFSKLSFFFFNFSFRCYKFFPLRGLGFRF